MSGPIRFLSDPVVERESRAFAFTSREQRTIGVGGLLLPSKQKPRSRDETLPHARAEPGFAVLSVMRPDRSPDDEYRRLVSQAQRVRTGYLLLADISGYTAFLAGTELEHANAIVRELTTLVRERLSPPMRFVKLEGDAVFCYADGAWFEDGERLVELIETCYLDFSSRLQDMKRETTCRCAACAAIGSLDLKFVAHYGSYVIESEDHREDLAGPDVILVHRLRTPRTTPGALWRVKGIQYAQTRTVRTRWFVEHLINETEHGLYLSLGRHPSWVRLPGGQKLDPATYAPALPSEFAPALAALRTDFDKFLPRGGRPPRIPCVLVNARAAPRRQT
jgi:hypothetical protein